MNEQTKETLPIDPSAPPAVGCDAGLGSVKYPATLRVSTPTGPVPACEKHAAQIKSLLAFMGTYAGYEPSGLNEECANCVNEAKLSNAPHEPRRNEGVD